LLNRATFYKKVALDLQPQVMEILDNDAALFQGMSSEVLLQRYPVSSLAFQFLGIVGQ
jgi:hypothetical protein